MTLEENMNERFKVGQVWEQRLTGYDFKKIPLAKIGRVSMLDYCYLAFKIKRIGTNDQVDIEWIKNPAGQFNDWHSIGFFKRELADGNIRLLYTEPEDVDHIWGFWGVWGSLFDKLGDDKCRNVEGEKLHADKLYSVVAITDSEVFLVLERDKYGRKNVEFTFPRSKFDKFKGKV